MSMMGSPNRTAPPTVTVLWGPPGTGKSRRAMQLAQAGGGTFYWIDGGRAFLRRATWDEYRGQSTLIIDGFDPMFEDPVAFAKIVLAGGRVPLHPRRDCLINRFARWSRVVITTNLPPGDWWNPAIIKKMP